MIKFKKVINDNGFTLVELIAVIAILAIVGTIATISYTLVFDNDLEASAENFKTDLREIRNRSMAYSYVYKLTWNVVSGECSYVIEWTTPAGDFTKEVKLGSSITVTKDGGSVNGVTISFDKSSGSVTSGEGLYVFTSNRSDESYTVQLTKETGGIFLEQN